MGCIYSNPVISGNRVEPILCTENPGKDRSTDKSELFVVTRKRSTKTCSSPTLARNPESLEVVEASPKVQRIEVKGVTGEQIKAELEKSEKRRKEIKEDMMKKLHSECRKTLAQKEIIEKHEFQKDNMVDIVKNREVRLKELRNKLKEKHNKSGILRGRREITEHDIGGSLVSRPGRQTSTGLSFEIVQLNPALPERHPASAKLETLSKNLNGREKMEEVNRMPKLSAEVTKEKEKLQMEKMMKAQMNREKRLADLRERLRVKEVRAARVRKMKDLNLDDLDEPS